MEQAAADPDLHLVVTSRRPVAADVVELTLERADGGDLPSWEAGAHIDLVLDDDVVRQYSLCGKPESRSAWRIAVLAVPSGRGGSAFVHAALLRGTPVRCRGPRNHFRLSGAASYLFVAGGIGITPILPMVREVAAAGARWTLVYGGRSRSSMAYLDELSQYGGIVDLWPLDERGLPQLDCIVADAPPGTVVHGCGPGPMLAALEEVCSDARVELRIERFASRTDLDPLPDREIEVTLARSERAVLVPAGVSILEALEDVGVFVLSSCQEGTCGTCVTTVLAGEPDHRDVVLTDEEREAGDAMMICCSRALGDALVLDL